MPHSETYEKLGWQYKHNGEYEKAIQAFDKAILHHQKTYFALHGKGECLTFLGRYDEALDCFAKAIKIDLNHNWAYFGAGRAHYLKGEYVSAKAFLERSIRCNSESVSAWLWLGKTLVKLHQEEEARDAFQKSLASAVKYRPDMIKEIETEILNITAYISPLKKRIEELEQENRNLKETLSSKGSIVVNGTVNGDILGENTTQIKDDAVVNRSELGGKSDEN